MSEKNKKMWYCLICTKFKTGMSIRFQGMIRYFYNFDGKLPEITKQTKQMAKLIIPFLIVFVLVFSIDGFSQQRRNTPKAAAKEDKKVEAKQEAEQTETETKSNPNLNRPKTLMYINDKVQKYTSDDDYRKKVKVNGLGQVEETFPDGNVIRYFLQDMDKIVVEHYSDRIYRVRIECPVAVSSCLSSDNPKDDLRPHTDFFIQPKVEADRLAQAFDHLKQILIDEKKFEDPFDDMVKAAEDAKPAPSKKKKKKKKRRKRRR